MSLWNVTVRVSGMSQCTVQLYPGQYPFVYATAEGHPDLAPRLRPVCSVRRSLIKHTWNTWSECRKGWLKAGQDPLRSMLGSVG